MSKKSLTIKLYLLILIIKISIHILVKIKKINIIKAVICIKFMVNRISYYSSL